MDVKTPVRLRGKAALRSIQVNHEDNFWERLYNSYIYTLRLPLPFFFLIMFSTPLLVSIVFTAFYLLDVDGLSIPQDHEWATRTTWLANLAGETEFKVFVFSLSLCTTFGGTGVEARSPYNLLLANLNTLTAQLIFVFLSGAVFHRLSQPGEPVRWAKTALITDDKFTEHADKMATPGKKSHKSFIIRVNLADPAKMVLIECKFEVVFRCILTPEGAHSPFIKNLPLRLVRPEISYLRFGLIIRHIIDESSPLYGMDFEKIDGIWDPLTNLTGFVCGCLFCKMLKVQDASFSITMSGTERSSMQPVFSESLYAIADGDVLWDRQYEDQLVTNNHGHTVFCAHVLDHLKSLDDDCKDHDEK